MKRYRCPKCAAEVETLDRADVFHECPKNHNKLTHYEQEQD